MIKERRTDYQTALDLINKDIENIAQAAQAKRMRLEEATTVSDIETLDVTGTESDSDILMADEQTSDAVDEEMIDFGPASNETEAGLDG
jgi:hypothetical protein